MLCAASTRLVWNGDHRCSWMRGIARLVRRGSEKWNGLNERCGSGNWYCTVYIAYEYISYVLALWTYSCSVCGCYATYARSNGSSHLWTLYSTLDKRRSITYTTPAYFDEMFVLTSVCIFAKNANDCRCSHFCLSTLIQRTELFVENISHVMESDSNPQIPIYHSNLRLFIIKMKLYSKFTL